MKFDVTDIDGARRKMEVVIPSAEVNERVEKSFREVGKTAKLKGFRPGKVPRNLLEKFFGPRVRSLVAEDLVKEFINKALDEAKIQPVAPPLVEPGEIKKGEDFSFVAQIEILPKIENVNFEGIEVEVPSTDVTDEDVEQNLEQLRQGAAQLKKPDPVRPVAMGDHVIVDFDARNDDGPVGSEKNVGVEIGSGTMPSEFEEGLVGSSEGDKKTLTVKYAEDAQTPMAGKTVIFNVEIKDIKLKIVPDLDDEFAKDVGRENLSDLKSNLKERICDRKEVESKEKARREIMSRLREKTPIDLPPSLVDAQRRITIEETKRQFEAMKIPFREEQFGEKFLETSRERVHDDILLDAIADAESIEVTEETVDARIEEWAKEAGHDPVKLKAALKAENRIEQIKSSLRAEKTVDFLMSAVTIKYVDQVNSTADTDTTESSEQEEPSERGEP